MTNMRGLVVDAQPQSGARLSQLLAQTLRPIEVDLSVGGAAPTRLEGQHYRAALIDVELPAGAGFALIHRARHARLPVIATALRCNRQLLGEALRAGAEGYLLKNDSADELSFCLAAFRRGAPAVSSTVLQELLGLYGKSPPGLRAESRPRPGLESRATSRCVSVTPEDFRVDAPADEALTAAERKVLHMVAGGVGVKQAAARLAVSPCTVATHVRSIYSKLGINRRAQAALAAQRLGLV